MVVGQSEASAERPDQFAGQARNDTGWLVGGDGGTACALGKTEGGKAPAAYLRGSFSRTTNTAPKNYDCDENDCAPFAPGSPTRPTGAAHGFNPKRRRACLCGGDPEEEGTSMAIAGRGGNDEGAKQDAL